MQTLVHKNEVLTGASKLMGTVQAVLESRAAEVALLGAVAVVVASSPALAGTDATFNTTVTQITNWAEGSLGKMAGVAGVTFALVGMVAKFDWRMIAGAAGIGLTAATGPDIVTGLASALI